MFFELIKLPINLSDLWKLVYQGILTIKLYKLSAKQALKGWMEHRVPKSAHTLASGDSEATSPCRQRWRGSSSPCSSALADTRGKGEFGMDAVCPPPTLYDDI